MFLGPAAPNGRAGGAGLESRSSFIGFSGGVGDLENGALSTQLSLRLLPPFQNNYNYKIQIYSINNINFVLSITKDKTISRTFSQKTTNVLFTHHKIQEVFL